MKSMIETYLPAGVSVEEYNGGLYMYAVPASEIVAHLVSLYKEHGLPLKTITALDEREKIGAFKIVYVFGIPGKQVFLAPYITATESFPSVTPKITEASLYERKIQTFFGLKAEGHPDPRSLILFEENWPKDIYPLRKDFKWNDRPAASKGAPYQFALVEGEGIYEIPVGPVHAGIIEPGHFRFSVAGEEIMLLEARLGYCHKGSEKLFEILPLDEKVRLSERISGDSSFSHSLAFCQALESLAEIEVPVRARYLRTIYAELERMAAHINDIAFILSDTGFNFGGAQGTRLRERVMQINDGLTGSRFMRGVNVIGGVTADIDEETAAALHAELAAIEKDFAEVISIAEGSSTVMERLNKTGTLSAKIAKDFGVVGIAAKATGRAIDARVDYPYAAYDTCTLHKVALGEKGDVFGRYSVRVQEVFSSIHLIQHALKDLPQGEIRSSVVPTSFRKNASSVSIVEGWRGDIVYFVATDDRGAISRVAVRDPSFLNWNGVGLSGPGNMVPDFPLINKSFNLSYTGNDL